MRTVYSFCAALSMIFANLYYGVALGVAVRVGVGVWVGVGVGVLQGRLTLAEGKDWWFGWST